MGYVCELPPIDGVQFRLLLICYDLLEGDPGFDKGHLQVQDQFTASANEVLDPCTLYGSTQKLLVDLKAKLNDPLGNFQILFPPLAGNIQDPQQLPAVKT